MSVGDVDRLEDQFLVELLVEGDEILGVLLRHVKIMRGLIDPSFDEHQTVGVVGAGIEIIGDATGLSAGCRLRLGCAGKDLVAGPGLAIDGNDELVHSV